MWPPARARARRQSGVRLGERLSRTDVDHAKRFPELRPVSGCQRTGPRLLLRRREHHRSPVRYTVGQITSAISLHSRSGSMGLSSLRANGAAASLAT